MALITKYYFTKFGEVYSAFDFAQTEIENHVVLIQSHKLKEYQELSLEQKTLENAKRYCQVFSNNVVAWETTSDKFTQPKPIENPFWINPDLNRKTMFILGAGASAYCVTGKKKENFMADPLRPPLGNELFAERFQFIYEKYKGVKLSLIELQDNADVEAYLEQEWKDIIESGDERTISRHMNIQFYIQELLKEISVRVNNEYYANNVYAHLAHKLQKIHARQPDKHFTFISFNQDTILENFLTEYFGYPIREIDDYVELNERPFSVFKPHGSWNWGWRFPRKRENIANWLYEQKANFYNLYFQELGGFQDMVDWLSYGLEMSHNEHGIGKYTIDKAKLQIQANGQGIDYYPAILLPYRDKDEFTMPPRHYYSLKSCFSYIETLIVIGWKGNEVLFNKLLVANASRIKKVVIVDPRPEAIEAQLNGLLNRPGVIKKNYTTFEEFVLSGLENEIM